VLSEFRDRLVGYCSKRSTEWLGYKVHITETCDDDTPNLITHIATVPATEHDSQIIEQVHANLAARELLPAEHLVDGGYVSSETLISSQRHEVDLYEPIQVDHSWQAAAGEGFDIACFTVDGRLSRLAAHIRQQHHNKVTPAWEDHALGRAILGFCSSRRRRPCPWRRREPACPRQ
jgi:hypothetical protein